MCNCSYRGRKTAGTEDPRTLPEPANAHNIKHDVRNIIHQKNKKWQGAIFNVAQRRPKGWLPGMAGHKNGREPFLTSSSDDPAGVAAKDGESQKRRERVCAQAPKGLSTWMC
jgi:hypothetical protein